MRRQLFLVACVVAASCARNKTPSVPHLEVKSGDETVSGEILLGQPITLRGDWYGNCEHWSGGDDKDHPFKGSYSPGTCGTVTTFDLKVTCSLPCWVGPQRVDGDTVYVDVVPRQAGKLSLDVLYTTPFHHDRHLPYSVTVSQPKSIALLGCANDKAISLDSYLLTAPGQQAMWQPVYCKKVDDEVEGPLRIVATTLEDKQMPIRFLAVGLYRPEAKELEIDGLVKAFGPETQPGIFPVRISVMGKDIDLAIDMREHVPKKHHEPGHLSDE